MINHAIWLADIDVLSKAGETTQVTQSLSHSAKGALIIVGVLALVAALIFLWAAVVRKPRKRKHSYEHWHSPKPAEGGDGADEEKRHHHNHGGSFHRRRRHRRHHRDRPLNPTLAETGGLPPVRKSGSPPPPP